MIIKRFLLENFRNYVCAAFELSPNTNVIYGENAQGKTNLLEAIYYLASGKSFRNSKDRELIRHGSDHAVINADMETPDLEYSLQAELFTGKRRKFIVNGVDVKTAGEISGRLRAVLFSPEDLYLVRDGAAARRKFMDAVFSQLRPNYAQLLAKYNRLHEHKTRILRDWKEKPALLEALPTFNLQIAEVGALLIGYRARFLDKITICASQIHKEISGNREVLSFRYKTVSTIDDPFESPERLRDKILLHMKTHREAELAAGSALSGPHKDDLEIYIDGQPAKSYASQGQTRTAALSLKMAERELFRIDSGVNPVLLLDDVLSEFDERRRDYILNRISDGQVIITLCNGSQQEFCSGRSFEIVSGSIKSQTDAGIGNVE